MYVSASLSPDVLKLRANKALGEFAVKVSSGQFSPIVAQVLNPDAEIVGRVPDFSPTVLDHPNY
jgi:hypothetical protein